MKKRPERPRAPLCHIAVMNWRAELREIEATIQAYQARAASLRRSIKAVEDNKEA